MNMIHFSNGLVEAGNVRNIITPAPLPSFNPPVDQHPGAEVKTTVEAPTPGAATPDTPLNAADLLPPIGPGLEAPAPEAEVKPEVTPEVTGEAKA